MVNTQADVSAQGRPRRTGTGGRMGRTRQPPFTWSVHTKFALGAAVVFTIAVGIGVSIGLVLETRAMERAHRERTGLIAASLRESMRRAMLVGGLNELHELFASYASHNPRGDADIINEDFEIVATTRPVPLGGRYPVGSIRKFVGPHITTRELDGEPVTARIEPVRNHSDCMQCHKDKPENSVLGYLVIRLSRRDLDKQVAGLRNALLLGAAVTLVLLLIASRIMLSVLVVEPLEELAEQMQRATEGDLNVQLPVRTPEDELSWVAQCFTTMMSRLVEARAALEETYRERLVRADRFATVGELASGLAHEIKNPLAGLSGALQILAKDFAPRSEQLEVAEEMQAQIRRLDRAVNGLLRFARPQPARLQTTNVNPIVERVVSLLAKQGSAGKIDLIVDLNATSLPRADASQLEQVFLNLGLNAFQAMKTGGQLRVSSHQTDKEVVVEFADTGPGIPSSVRQSIFKPFFTTKTTGTGLGLAISNRIVADHHGRIEVDCPAEGGTVFSVFLPLNNASGSVSPAEPQKSHSRSVDV